MLSRSSHGGRVLYCRVRRSSLNRWRIVYVIAVIIIELFFLFSNMLCLIMVLLFMLMLLIAFPFFLSFRFVGALSLLLRSCCWGWWWWRCCPLVRFCNRRRSSTRRCGCTSVGATPISSNRTANDFFVWKWNRPNDGCQVAIGLHGDATWRQRDVLLLVLLLIDDVIVIDVIITDASRAATASSIRFRCIFVATTARGFGTIRAPKRRVVVALWTLCMGIWARIQKTYTYSHSRRGRR